jgi:hypothetical protein
VQAFEIEGLSAPARPRRARLSLPPHRRPARRSPTLLIIDEGWLALDDEGFAGQLREWLKTLRKKNASVIFATQSLSDIDGSNIAPAIIESCPTRLLLPNERAIEPQITAIYRRFGLNDRQIEILARGPSATITASRGAATACSSWACPKSASRSAPHRPRPTRPDRAHRRRAWPRRLPRRLAAPARRRVGRRPHPRPHEPHPQQSEKE